MLTGNLKKPYITPNRINYQNQKWLIKIKFKLIFLKNFDCIKPEKT